MALLSYLIAHTQNKLSLDLCWTQENGCISNLCYNGR